MIDPGLLHRNDDELIRSVVAERRDRQAGRVHSSADSLRARAHESVKLLGGVVALLGRIDMVNVLYKPVEGQTGIVLVVIVVSVPVEGRSGPLVQSAQGSLRGGNRETFPLVLCGLVHVLEVAVFSEPDRRIWILAGAHALHLQTYRVRPIGVESKDANLLHEIRLLNDGVDVVGGNDGLLGDHQPDVPQTLLLHPARHSAQQLGHLIGIDPRSFRRVAVGFVDWAEVLEIDPGPVPRVNRERYHLLGELVVHGGTQMVRLHRARVAHAT